MRLAKTIALILVAFGGVTVVFAGDMKDVLLIEPANAKLLRSKFGIYGPRPARCLAFEGTGMRVSLTANMTGVSQTGIYSLFSLAGDCEVSCGYELISVSKPSGGYGSGVGIAFDAGEGQGRGLIQRVQKPKESGYVLQCGMTKSGSPEECKLVASTSKRGRIGLRRIDRELIFLAANSPEGALEEVGRMPFTEGTISAVRFFGDTGESPNAVNVRVRDIVIRADEIAGGVPLLEQERWSTWWLVTLIVPAAAGFWYWRRSCATAE